jgi:uncharacterized membrane protein
MELLTNILITYGIAYLLTESFILEKPRNYIARKCGRYIGNMVYCSICISFWVGIILTGNILEAFAIMGTTAIINKL